MGRIQLSIILGAAVGLCYATSFPGAFHYDDYPLILENSRVTGGAFDYTAFLEQYGGRPLTLYTFHLNYHLFGAEPASYHTFSVLLHGLGAILLFQVLVKWGVPTSIAWLASLLFVIHPAQVQAVNYIWSRSMLLMTVFAFAAFWLVRGRSWLCLPFFQLAVWSRAEALILVVPLFLASREIRGRLALLFTMNLAGILYGLARYSPREMAWNHPRWADYLWQAPVALWKYVLLLLFPQDLTVFHGPLETGVVTTLISCAGLAALLIGLYVFRQRSPRLVVGSTWFILLLVPSLSTPNSDIFNESRSYVAAAGLCLVLAHLLLVGGGRLGENVGSWIERDAVNRLAPKLVPLFLVVMLLAGWLPLTYARHTVWKDDVALWEEAVSRGGQLSLPRYNLAVALARRGSLSEAEAQFAEGTRLNPRDDMSYAGLGFCAEYRGEWRRALNLYNRALIINPENSYAQDARERLATALASGELEP